MASKDNSPAISFFSFQDIITSVTGIMFLVVIMLVLMVLQQTPGAPQTKAREVQEELAALEKKMNQLQQSLEQLKKQAAEQRKRIEELKKLRIEELPAMKQKLVQQLRSLDNAIVQLSEENEQIIQSQLEQKELQKQAEIALQKNNDKLNDLKKQLLALDDEIKQKELIYQKFKNVVRFVWDKSNSKRPILLECSETEITVNSLDGKIKRKSFKDYSLCMDYCRTFPVDDTYFILLLKPSAFSYGEKFSRELQKAGFERGREVLPDEQMLITGDLSK